MNINTLRNRIGIPPRTPLVALFRVKDAWHVWIAVRDPQARYSEWQGTYLALDDAGGVCRVTVYDDGHEDVMIVKGSDDEILG